MNFFMTEQVKGDLLISDDCLIEVTVRAGLTLITNTLCSCKQTIDAA